MGKSTLIDMPGYYRKATPYSKITSPHQCRFRKTFIFEVNNYNVRVLIVDDEELDLFINKKLLSLEFETEGFTTVKDTLDWAANNDFDVAIIDYYLGPGIFASTLLNQLIAIKGNTFKAFAVSNYVDEKQAQELRGAGFADIIYKPLTLETFKEKIGA